MVSQPPFSLIQNRTADLCASLAYLRAKHCICQRKALHPPTQSIASANAKHCICQRKALQSPTQSFATILTNVCWKRHLHLGPIPMFFSTEPFWDCSYAKGDFSLLLINGTLLIVEPSFHQLYTAVCVDQELLPWAEPSVACRQGCIWHEEPRRNGRWP